MADCKANPFAVCRDLQNKHKWSNKKTERCIKKIKKECPNWEDTPT